MKVLVIGLGSIGQRHVRNLRTLFGTSVEIVAYRVRGWSQVVTPNLKADPKRHVVDEYGIQVMTNLEAALATKPRVALICNPTSEHVPTAMACLRAGCDVLLEKPVAPSLAGVAALMSEAWARGRIVMVGYQMRFHPLFRWLQELVSGNSLGRLLTARATVGEYLPGWHPYEDYRRGYAARNDLGGGVIVTQIHELDYLYALFGTPRRVFALGGHWSHLEIDVEDTASMLMECQIDGRPLPVHLQQDYLQRPATRECEIVGDQGRAYVDFLSGTAMRVDSTGEIADQKIVAGFERNQMFVDELQHFFACVESRRKPVVDLTDGVESLRIAVAARLSIASGEVIPLDSVVVTPERYAGQ